MSDRRTQVLHLFWDFLVQTYLLQAPQSPITPITPLDLLLFAPSRCLHLQPCCWKWFEPLWLHHFLLLQLLLVFLFFCGALGFSLFSRRWWLPLCPYRSWRMMRCLCSFLHLSEKHPVISKKSICCEDSSGVCDQLLRSEGEYLFRPVQIYEDGGVFELF